MCHRNTHHNHGGIHQMSAQSAPIPTNKEKEDEKPLPPTLWRIIRAYLNVRESAKYNDIQQYADQVLKANGKRLDLKSFNNKMTRLKRAGDIKSVRHGIYAITQQGRKDMDGPDGEGLYDKTPQTPPEPSAVPSMAKGAGLFPSQAASEAFAKELAKTNPTQHLRVQVQTPDSTSQDVYINLKIRVSVEVVR